jgi:hypothetical protein
LRASVCPVRTQTSPSVTHPLFCFYFILFFLPHFLQLQRRLTAGHPCPRRRPPTLSSSAAQALTAGHLPRSSGHRKVRGSLGGSDHLLSVRRRSRDLGAASSPTPADLEIPGPQAVAIPERELWREASSLGRDQATASGQRPQARARHGQASKRSGGLGCVGTRRRSRLRGRARVVLEYAGGGGRASAKWSEQRRQ